MIESHFLIPFLSIAAAEFGDKTQLGVMLLASKTKKRWSLFWGVMLGFLVVDGLAILLGATVTRLVPMQVIKWISGALFLIFGILILRDQSKCEEEGEARASSGNPFWLGFAMIGTAEWGDKTQIACGIFAARFHPLAVLAGAMSALSLLSLLALVAGGWVSKKIPEKIVHRVAGILFLLIGLSCFLPF